MAITIDYNTFVISHPQSELVLISGTLYKEDTNETRKKLKLIEASEDGIVFSNTHKHNTTVTLFGVTYARTIEILAPYSITYTPDAQWSVRLDGSNNNIGDVEAGILNQNQVQVIPTNSAGLQDLGTLLASAYQGKIVISPTFGQEGTVSPIGTFHSPSNNIVDAIVLAETFGVNELFFTEAMTIIENLSGSISGKALNVTCSSVFHVITLDPLAELSGVAFTNLTLTGATDGVNTIRESNIIDITGFSGFCFQVNVASGIEIIDDAYFMQCFSGKAGAAIPVFNVVSGNLVLRDFSGSANLENISSGDHSIGIYGGRVIIDATCIGGTIHIRGDVFEIVDNSGAGCTVLDERSDIWSIVEKEESLAYSRKSSDNAEQANLKL